MTEYMAHLDNLWLVNEFRTEGLGKSQCQKRLKTLELIYQTPTGDKPHSLWRPLNALLWVDIFDLLHLHTQPPGSIISELWLFEGQMLLIKLTHTTPQGLEEALKDLNKQKASFGLLFSKEE